MRGKKKTSQKSKTAKQPKGGRALKKFEKAFNEYESHAAEFDILLQQDQFAEDLAELVKGYAMRLFARSVREPDPQAYAKQGLLRLNLSEEEVNRLIENVPMSQLETSIHELTELKRRYVTAAMSAHLAAICDGKKASDKIVRAQFGRSNAR